MKHFRDGRDAIFAEGDTEVLLDGCDEGVIGPEHLASILHDGKQHLQGEDLGSQFMRPEWMGNTQLFCKMIKIYGEVKIIH